MRQRHSSQHHKNLKFGKKTEAHTHTDTRQRSETQSDENNQVSFSSPRGDRDLAAATTAAAAATTTGHPLLLQSQQWRVARFSLTRQAALPTLSLTPASDLFHQHNARRLHSSTTTTHTNGATPTGQPSRPLADLKSVACHYTHSNKVSGQKSRQTGTKQSRGEGKAAKKRAERRESEEKRKRERQKTRLTSSGERRAQRQRVLIRCRRLQHSSLPHSYDFLILIFPYTGLPLNETHLKDQ